MLDVARNKQGVAIVAQEVEHLLFGRLVVRETAPVSMLNILTPSCLLFCLNKASCIKHFNCSGRVEKYHLRSSPFTIFDTSHKRATLPVHCTLNIFNG